MNKLKTILAVTKMDAGFGGEVLLAPSGNYVVHIVITPVNVNKVVNVLYVI